MKTRSVLSEKKIIIFFNDVKTTESDLNPFEYFNTCHRYHEIISIAFLSRGFLRLSLPRFFCSFPQKKTPRLSPVKKKQINFFYDPRFFKKLKLFTRRRIFVFLTGKILYVFFEGGEGKNVKKPVFFNVIQGGGINTERHNLKQVYLVTATGIKKTPGVYFLDPMVFTSVFFRTEFTYEPGALKTGLLFFNAVGL